MAVYPNGLKTRPSVSSNYGKRTPIKTPAGWTSPFHTGTDMVGFEEIKAVMAGTVIYAAYNDANGNEVRIQHADGSISRYYHMEPDLRVRAGQSVSEGQHIGDKGATGMATGEHLHFRVDWPLGTHHDPLEWLAVVVNGTQPTPSLPGGALTPADVRGFSFQQIKGDGLVYWEPTGVLARRIQQGMKNAGVYFDLVDGKWGTNSRKAVQAIAKQGGYTGPKDGRIGKNTIKGVQTVAKKGGYTGLIDGIPAEYTWVGFARALGV